MTRNSLQPKRRRVVSPITWRILAVNVLALAILVAGLLFLGEYRRNLIDAELTALRGQAEMIAGALGESATATDPAMPMMKGVLITSSTLRKRLRCSNRLCDASTWE